MVINMLVKYGVSKQMFTILFEPINTLMLHMEIMTTLCQQQYNNWAGQ